MASDNELQAPARSQEQRIEALKKANAVRVSRARIKRQISSGELRIADILADPPEDLTTAKVFDVLMAIRKFGRVKATRLLQQHRISQTKTIGGLSDRQRHELIKHFGGKSDLSHLPPLS